MLKGALIRARRRYRSGQLRFPPGIPRAETVGSAERVLYCEMAPRYSVYPERGVRAVKPNSPLATPYVWGYSSTMGIPQAMIPSVRLFRVIRFASKWFAVRWNISTVRGAPSSPSAPRARLIAVFGTPNTCVGVATRFTRQSRNICNPRCAPLSSRVRRITCAPLGRPFIAPSAPSIARAAGRSSSIHSTAPLSRRFLGRPADRDR